MNDLDKTILRYINALDNADFQVVNRIWQQAENDSELMQALLEIHDEMKDYTQMMPFPTARYRNNGSVRWLRIAVALLIATGVIMLALSLSNSDSPVQSTPLHQGEPVITARNVQELEIVRTLGNGRVEGAQWSPDGQTLMFYGTGGVWLLSDGLWYQNPAFIDAGADVYHAEYTEDGAQIIYGTREGISALTVESGSNELLISNDKQHITKFDYHDGLIAFMGETGLVGVWDIERARPLYLIPQYSLENHTVAISDDGTFFAFATMTTSPASGANDPPQIAPLINVVDMDSGRIVQVLRSFEGHVDDIDFYDNQLIAAVEGRIFTWQLDDSASADTPQKVDLSRDYAFGLAGLVRNEDSYIGLRQRLDAALFRYFPEDGTVDTIQYGRTFGLPTTFALHPDGETVAIINSHRHVDIVDLNTNSITATVGISWNGDYPQSYWNSGYYELDMKDDLIAAFSSYLIEIFDLETGVVKSNWSDDDIGSITFAQDEELLVYRGTNNVFNTRASLKLWYYDSLRSESITTAQFLFSNVVFGPDEDILYYADGFRLKSYQHSTRTEEIVWEAPETQMQGIDHIILSPDNTQLAMSSHALVYIYDIAQHEVVATVEGHPYLISDLAYSPDGTWLASSDAQGTVIFWDTETWQELAYLTDQPGRTLAVSPDGALVATAGEQSITIIDTTTYEIITEITAPGHISDIAFSDDGTRLIGASYNGKIYVWGVLNGRD